MLCHNLESARALSRVCRHVIMQNMRLVLVKNEKILIQQLLVDKFRQENLHNWLIFASLRITLASFKMECNKVLDANLKLCAYKKSKGSISRKKLGEIVMIILLSEKKPVNHFFC